MCKIRIYNEFVMRYPERSHLCASSSHLSLKCILATIGVLICAALKEHTNEANMSPNFDIAGIFTVKLHTLKLFQNNILESYFDFFIGPDGFLFYCYDLRDRR